MRGYNFLRNRLVRYLTKKNKIITFSKKNKKLQEIEVGILML